MPWEMDRLTPAELHMIEAAEEVDLMPGDEQPARRREPADPFAHVPDALRQL